MSTQGTSSSYASDITLQAGADLSAKQFYFVKLNAAKQVIVCAAATDVPIGILQNKPAASGEDAIVRFFGHSKVSANASLTAGNLIGTSSDGQADAKTPGTDTTEYTVGQMLTSPGAANGIGECLVNCASPARAA